MTLAVRGAHMRIIAVRKTSRARKIDGGTDLHEDSPARDLPSQEH